jgi:hypothetical protein
MLFTALERWGKHVLQHYRATKQEPNIAPDTMAMVMITELKINLGTANTVKTAIKIIEPTMLAHHGAKELCSIARKWADKNHNNPDDFQLEVFEAIERWAQHELQKYRSARQAEEEGGE